MPIAAVQRKSKAVLASSSGSIGAGDGWATPTSGNLLVATINGDNTANTPTGYTAGPSVVDNNAVYLYWKISDGTESTVTLTEAAATDMVITACEYSGVAASPFDASNTSTNAGSLGTTTTSASVTTTAAGDLVIAVAGLYIFTSSNSPTGPTWTNSFTNVLDQQATGASNAGHTFYAELIAGAAGSYGTSCSWTTQMSDRQELVIAFKAAATAASATPEPFVSPTTVRPVLPNPPIVVRSTLADPPVLTTRPPLVVTQPAPKPVANQGLTWRNTLQDPPVLTTPAPLVVSQPARFTLPNQALLSRSSLVDVAIVTQATPPPLVVTQPEKPRPGTPPVILRNTLVDPPVLTTPQPIVVTAPSAPVPVAQPTIQRSSLQDFATPQPLVVSQPYKLVAGTPPVILRSSLQDLSTPQPLVVVPPAVKPWNTPPVILRSSLADVSTVISVPGRLAPATRGPRVASASAAGRITPSTSGGHA